MSIHSSARSLLTQLDQIIIQITDDEFIAPLPVLSNSTIGQHIRHTLEFFICLLDGANEETINYDNRKHDRVIEENRKIARSLIRSIIEFLSRNPEDFATCFEANYELVPDKTITTQSSFYRELAYTIEHAIHHMALIKIGIYSLNRTIELPKHFGVASSTVRYQLDQKD